MTLKDLFDNNTIPELGKPQDLFLQDKHHLLFLYIFSFAFLNLEKMASFYQISNIPFFVSVSLKALFVCFAMESLFKTFRIIVWVGSESSVFEKRLESAHVNLERKTFIVNDNEEIELNNKNCYNYVVWNKIPQDNFNETTYVLKNCLFNLSSWLILSCLGLLILVSLKNA